MTNTTPSTASTPVSRAAVDEAVRIAADSSRRATDNAQAAVAAGQQFLDFANQINRDLFSLWTSAVETSLQATFETQNAALASSQSLFDTSAKINKDALNRWIDVARQSQATTLKAYQSSTKLFGSLTHE
jgi:translation elongation factor EF-Ts